MQGDTAATSSFDKMQVDLANKLQLKCGKEMRFETLNYTNFPGAANV